MPAPLSRPGFAVKPWILDHTRSAKNMYCKALVTNPELLELPLLDHQPYRDDMAASYK